MPYPTPLPVHLRSVAREEDDFMEPRFARRLFYDARPSRPKERQASRSWARLLATSRRPFITR